MPYRAGSATSVGDASVTSLTGGNALPRPIGAVQGDTLQVLVYLESQVLTPVFATGTWIKVTPASGKNTNATVNFETHVYQCQQGPETGAIDISWGGATVWAIAVGACYVDRRGGDALDALPTYNESETTNATVTASQVTTVSPDCDIVALASNPGGRAYSWSVVSERIDFAGQSIADVVQAVPGASGNKTATLALAQEWSVGLIALAPTLVVGPEPRMWHPGAGIFTQARFLKTEQDATVAAAPSGTLWLQDVDGTLTSVGDLVTATGKVLGGGLTPAGTLLKQTARALVGTLTSAGALVKRTSRALTGTLTTAGTLAKQTGKALGGTLTSSGALTKQAGKVLTGTLTPAGALIKQTRRSLSGTLTSAGTLTALAIKQIALTATLSLSGALRTQTGKVLSGTLTTAGSLTRQANTALTATLTAAGSLSAVRTILLALTGTLAMAGDLTKQTQRSLTGVLTSLGDLIKQTWKDLVGVLTGSGDLETLLGGGTGTGVGGAIQGYCGMECPGNEQADVFSNNGALFSRDSARQGRYGFPLRTPNNILTGVLDISSTGTNPHSLSWAYMRAWVRVRSYCASGEDQFWQVSNDRGASTYLTIDSSGAVRMYEIPGNFGTRVEVSAYIASYTTIPLTLNVWYQLVWYVAWGINAYFGPPADIPGPVVPFMRLLAIREDTHAQSGWGGSAISSFPASWMAVAPTTHTRTYCQTTRMILGNMAISGNAYHGTRMDLDSLSADGLLGNEFVGGIPDDLTPSGPLAGDLFPRMVTPTRIPLTGTISAGSWVLAGTATPLTYRMLNDDVPASQDSIGCVSSTTVSDSFEVTCGTPEDAGFGEDGLGVFVSLRLVASPFANHTLRVKIGGSTYSKTFAGAGGNQYVRFQLPTPGLAPEFTVFGANEEIRVSVVKDASANQVAIQNIHVEVIGTQDWTPAPDPSETVSVMTGVYTGNGSTQEIVTPHEPHWIWVSPAAAGVSDGVYWHDTKLGSTEWISIGQTTHLLSPSANGFIVSGNEFETNKNGTAYRWYAIRDGTQRLLYRGAFMEATAGDYTIPDGLGVLPTDFGTPVVCWAHIDDFQLPGSTGAYYRGLGHTSNLSSAITGADVATALQTMPVPGGGITIGSTLQQAARSQTSFTAWSLAFFAHKLWGVASWTGTGTSSRDIAVDLGGQGGGWCLAFSRAGGQAFYRHASLTGTISMTVASGALNASTGITGFKNDVVTVGSNLNSNGVLYELLVIVDPAWDASLNGGLGGSGGTSGEASDAPPEGGCLVTLGSGTDSGGGSGCAPGLATGSDSGGGSGCAVT